MEGCTRTRFGRERREALSWAEGRRAGSGVYVADGEGGKEKGDRMWMWESQEPGGRRELRGALEMDGEEER